MNDLFAYLFHREESVAAHPPSAALPNPFGSGEEERRWVAHVQSAVIEHLKSFHSTAAFWLGCGLWLLRRANDVACTIKW